MEELGTILRETRQARGVTIDDVAQVTRIRPRYLEALEEERYDVLPTAVHVRGFLRNYSQYLSLDPEPLIARYNASRSVVKDIPLAKQVRPELDKAQPPPPETLDSELESEPVFYRPAGINLQAPAWFSRDILIAVFLVLALAAILIWAGNRFLVPAITGAQATETPAATNVLSQETSAAQTVVPAVTSTASPASIEPTSPPIFSSIQLQITVLERSWLTVVVDGETVQDGMTGAGDLFAWEGLDQVELRTGNGAGLSVTLNGQELDPLGGRGEVVEKIWGLAGEIAPTPPPPPTATNTPIATPSLVPTQAIPETPTPSPSPDEG